MISNSSWNNQECRFTIINYWNTLAIQWLPKTFEMGDNGNGETSLITADWHKATIVGLQVSPTKPEPKLRQ